MATAYTYSAYGNLRSGRKAKMFGWVRRLFMSKKRKAQLALVQRLRPDVTDIPAATKLEIASLEPPAPRPKPTLVHSRARFAPAAAVLPVQPFDAMGVALGATAAAEASRDDDSKPAA